MPISTSGIMPGDTCGFDSSNAVPPPAQQPLECNNGSAVTPDGYLLPRTVDMLI
jgi:hypothetical protein